MAASYCHPGNKVSLGLVEGLKNKIRVLQRRAVGYCDEDYLKLKIVAAFLPPLTRQRKRTHCDARSPDILDKSGSTHFPWRGRQPLKQTPIAHKARFISLKETEEVTRERNE